MQLYNDDIEKSSIMRICFLQTQTQLSSCRLVCMKSTLVENVGAELFRWDLATTTKSTQTSLRTLTISSGHIPPLQPAHNALPQANSHIAHHERHRRQRRSSTPTVSIST